MLAILYSLPHITILFHECVTEESVSEYSEPSVWECHLKLCGK